MKKLVKTVAILMAAAVAVGSFVGCSNQVEEMGDDVGNWKGAERVDGEAKSIQLTIDDGYDISWWRWTDGKRQILTTQPKVTPAPTDGKLLKGKTYTFSFPSAAEYQLNYFQPGKKYTIKEDDVEKQVELDCRGAIKTHDSKSTKILTSKHPEQVNQQAEFWLENNEPKTESKTYSYFYNNPDLDVKNTKDRQQGDYTIQEIWVLTPQKGQGDAMGQQYEAKENLKLTKLNIKKGDKVGVLIPVGKTVVTTNQKNRAVSTTTGKNAEYWKFFGTDQDKTVEANKKGDAKGKVVSGHDDLWYISDTRRKAKEDEYWGMHVNSTAHTSNGTAQKSSEMQECTFNKKVGGFDRIKSATNPDTEIITLHAGIPGEK